MTTVEQGKEIAAEQLARNLTHRQNVEHATKEIAALLGETEPIAIRRVQTIVFHLGPERAQALLSETEAVEARDGMLTSDGSRRRTKGGVWFKLAKDELMAHDTHLAYSVFRSDTPRKQKRKQQPQPRTPPMTWQGRLSILRQFNRVEKGQATVKITVVGRPLNFSDQGSCILAVVEGREPTSLSKGLPKPPQNKTSYAVYISSKQWQKVVSSLQDPADVLIVEGYPHLDMETGTIAVFATNTTTKLLQAAMKQQQQQQSAGTSA